MERYSCRETLRRRRRTRTMEAICAALVCAVSVLLIGAALSPYIIDYVNGNIKIESYAAAAQTDSPRSVTVFANDSAAATDDDGDLTAGGSMPDDIVPVGFDFIPPKPAALPDDIPVNIYASLSYYVADNIYDYEAYQGKNPSFSLEEVVWRVNANLHKPMFENPYVHTEADPLLINPYNRLPDDFVPRELVNIYPNSAVYKVTPETYLAFIKLREAASVEGYDLVVASAYRTIAYQRGLYERNGGRNSVAPAGFSEHNAGRAIDLAGPGGVLLDGFGPRSATGIWVEEHAHEYGFIVRYKANTIAITGYIYEPWHITYVGNYIASQMNALAIETLEEYVAKYPEAALPQMEFERLPAVRYNQANISN